MPRPIVVDGGKTRPVKEAHSLELTSFQNIEKEEVTWLYDPYVPRGKLTLIAAYPGTGKTYLMCYMAACVSRGRSFFNICPFNAEPENVIYLSAEDGAGDTLKKRLEECGADMSKVFTVLDRNADLNFDSQNIENLIKQSSPALMVFDPFQAYIGADTQLNAANETRQKLNNILELAEKYNVAIAIICHFNKNQKGDAITRILGSTDIVGACRSYMALGNVPGEEDIKYMSHEKSSLARRGKTQLFEINPEEGGIKSLGENNMSMDDYTAIRSKQRVGTAPAREAAKQFLINQMPEGKRAAKELFNLAEAAGIDITTLKRAAQELGIAKKREGFQGASVWYLINTESSGTPRETS